MELWFDQNGLNIIIILLVLFFVVVFFWKKIFIVVPAGHGAVLFQPFQGGTQKDLYEEGLHIIAPWNELTVYDTRLQMIMDTVKAQSKQGMAVNLVFAARYIPKREKLFEIHKFIGPDYVEKIVIPEAIGELRDILSNQHADNLYTISEAELQSEFLESVKKDIGESWILFEDIKVLRVITPKTFETAVTQKHVQEQKSREYAHIIEQANRELERKKLDAEGIATFERISGVSYLKYRSIQATEALSTSPNAKVIVVGNGNKDVPIVLSEGN
ncbi:MAG: hypothetical protein RL675_811 [Bacteroidota bacterium]